MKYAGRGIQLILITCVSIRYIQKKTIFKRFYITFFRTSYTYSSEKKVKPLKNCFFEPNLEKIEVIVSHTLNGKQFFFGWNNYRRSLAFRNVLFYQNIKCLDWILSFKWFFCQKSITSSLNCCELNYDLKIAFIRICLFGTFIFVATLVDNAWIFY